MVNIVYPQIIFFDPPNRAYFHWNGLKAAAVASEVGAEVSKNFQVKLPGCHPWISLKFEKQHHWKTAEFETSIGENDLIWNYVLL